MIGCLSNTNHSRTTGPQRLRVTSMITGSRLAIHQEPQRARFCGRRIYGSEVRSILARVSGLLAGWKIVNRLPPSACVSASEISLAASPRSSEDVPAWWMGRYGGSLRNVGVHRWLFVGVRLSRRQPGMP